MKNTEDRRLLRTLCRFFTPCTGQISAARASGLSSGFFAGGGVKKGSDLGVNVAVLVMGEEFDSHVHGLFGSTLLTLLLLLLPSVKSKLRFRNENIAVKSEACASLAAAFSPAQNGQFEIRGHFFCRPGEVAYRVRIGGRTRA